MAILCPKCGECMSAAALATHKCPKPKSWEQLKKEAHQHVLDILAEKKKSEERALKSNMKFG